MYLLYCDESNLEPRSGDFFIYGGLVVDSQKILGLSKDIEQIRLTANVPRDEILKFNPRPQNLSHGDFNALKQQVIEAAINRGCKFLASMILHDIATTPDIARRNCINTICFHFDCLLSRPNSHGLVLVDRFSDSQIDAHLREKFSIGLRDMPYSRELRLERIVGFHYSAIGQSHIPSVLDIVLGSFRYAINAHTRSDADRRSSASTLLRMLAPLFWREMDNRVSEISLMFSPKVIKSAKFRAVYASTCECLTEHGINPAQVITGERMY